MSTLRDLERLRLEDRAQRMEAVVRELRARARYRQDRDGEVPAPLREAIDGFRKELAGIDRRLGGGRSRRVARDSS
jgi:hypothetical protein